MQQTIGVIGLGAMGLPIARRLARAGFRLAAFDPDPRAVEAVLAEGVQGAASPGAVVEASGILLTCLPNPQTVETVYGGIAKPGLLACDCSTVGPGLAIRLHEELAARGVRYLECPMLGAPAQAASGELFLILSGDAAAAQKVTAFAECQSMSMEQFAKQLSLLSPAYFRDGPIVDRTDLKGGFDFSLGWMLLSEIENGSDGPSMFAAVEKLGLKLDKRKEQADVVMVDSIQPTPTEN